jgi:carboxypeptidase C (cathepsin A)
VQNVANAVPFRGHDAFAGKALEPYTVNGVEKGMFKTQDNFSFLRVYEAGHMVMFSRKLIEKCWIERG